MSKAFISYSTVDEPIAKQLYAALTNVGVDTFLASISLRGGDGWTEEIFTKLGAADWVFFIASKNACASPSVQQELGASLAHGKTIIPILTDIAPEELPGWTKKHQAIDLRKGPETLRQTIEAIGQKVREDKFWSGVVVGALVVALAALLVKK